jgi:amidohydrolase
MTSISKNSNLNLWKVKVKGKNKGKEIFLKVKVKEEENNILVEASPLLQVLGYQMDYNQTNKEITIEQREVKKLLYLLDSTTQEMFRAIDQVKDEIIKASFAIHQYAEQGNREFKSSQLLVDKLKKYGFTVEYGLDGIKDGKKVRLDTAFKATLKGKSKGPTIYIMLEYDALPMGHGCGHNLIAASGLTAAIGLSQFMAELPGALVVIGTPAEDGGPLRGKEPLLKGGHFQGADIVFITHPGNLWTTYSCFLAVNGAIIDYQGLPSHAAVAPEKGINALKAAYLTLNAIDALREHILPDSRIHAIISEGGLAPNIVPEKARIDLRARSLNTSYVKDLMKKIENAARGAALAIGAKVDIKWRGIQPASINVPILNELILANASYFKVSPIIREEKLIGSSDLAFIAQELPTVNLFFKICPAAALHTYEFMKAATSPEGQEAMLIAGKVLALSAYQLFTHTEKVEEVKKEFKSIKLSQKVNKK